MSNFDVSAFNKMGFSKESQKDMFTARVRVAGGYVSAENMKTIIDIAQRFGAGYILNTVRQSIYIPHIKGEYVLEVKKLFDGAGVQLNIKGSCLHTIVACKGGELCRKGNLNVIKFAKEIEELFFNRTSTSCNIKIGVVGCISNCAKAEIHDIGIRGGAAPTWKKDDCVFCGACERRCPVKAIKVDKENSTLSYNKRKCINCGRCVKICNKYAWMGKNGFILYFGGRFGKHISIGKKIIPMVFDKQDVFNVIEASTNFFEANVQAGEERFVNVIDRVGWDVFKSEIKAAMSKKKSGI